MSMLLLAMLQAAAQPTADRAARCAALAAASPVEAVAEAGSWRVAGGGLQAQHCLGLAYSTQARWAPAAGAFEVAAREAEVARDARAAGFWLQAGNAWLAGADATRARAAFDAALALGTLAGEALGEAHLDRARALVLGKDDAAARAALDQALALVPADPLAWLLSATLARRAGELPRAQRDIAQALTRSGDDALVRLEAGNIAAAAGDEGEARAQWNAAIVAAPTSPMAASAKAALRHLDTPAP